MWQSKHVAVKGDSARLPCYSHAHDHLRHSPLYLSHSVQPMCADYGFRSGAGRLYMEHYGETPKGVVELVGSSYSPRPPTQLPHPCGPPHTAGYTAGCSLAKGDFQLV